jgi:general secretion pathway protein B
MSYILDALKKSDQDRQKGSGPSLQTIHRPLRLQNESSLLKLILSLLLLLLIGLVGLGSWYWFSRVEISPQAEIDSLDNTENNTIHPLSDVSNNSIITSSDDTAGRSFGKFKEKPLINVSAIRFNDLDSKTRSEIPSLTFSFHVYSDNPQRRTIIINGRRVSEGNLVEKDLVLEEITPLGVMFIWKNTVRFSIDVVESW